MRAGARHLSALLRSPQAPFCEAAEMRAAVSFPSCFAIRMNAAFCDGRGRGSALFVHDRDLDRARRGSRRMAKQKKKTRGGGIGKADLIPESWLRCRPAGVGGLFLLRQKPRPPDRGDRSGGRVSPRQRHSSESRSLLLPYTDSSGKRDFSDLVSFFTYFRRWWRVRCGRRTGETGFLPKKSGRSRFLPLPARANAVIIYVRHYIDNRNYIWIVGKIR